MLKSMSIQIKKYVSKNYLQLSLFSSGNFWARKSTSFYKIIGWTIRQYLNSSSTSFYSVAHKGCKIGCFIVKISWATNYSKSTSAKEQLKPMPMFLDITVKLWIFQFSCLFQYRILFILCHIRLRKL